MEKNKKFKINKNIKDNDFEIVYITKMTEDEFNERKQYLQKAISNYEQQINHLERLKSLAEDELKEIMLF